MHPEHPLDPLPAEISLPKPEYVVPRLHKNQMMNKKSLRRERREWAAIPQSTHSKNTVNPIRRIADAMTVLPNPNKSMIKLHLGDPTITGELPPSKEALAAITESLHSHTSDGYGPAVGDLKAREAVAKRFSTQEAPLHADDVILASGASHALQMTIEAIANPGDNILVPIPGFPLYTTLMRAHGIEDRGYRLDMSNGGLIDLVDLESKVDEKTRAIIVNNPGNPVGNVLPKWHLEKILELADRLRVPIIADEIYGDLVYDGATFHYMATLSPQVPLISCDGLAKRWMVPGWRMGWCNIYDRHGALTEVKKGMVALSQKIVGPCSLIQGALPRILSDTPESFFENNRVVIARNARTCYEQLKNVPGLNPVRPHGAMYMMVEVDPSVYGDETHFSQELIREQSVFCLPGAAFFAPGWIRLVLTYSEAVTMEACDRIRQFCAEHYQPINNNVIEDEEEPVEVSSSDEGIYASNTDSD